MYHEQYRAGAAADFFLRYTCQKIYLMILTTIYVFATDTISRRKPPTIVMIGAILPVKIGHKNEQYSSTYYALHMDLPSPGYVQQ